MRFYRLPIGNIIEIIGAAFLVWGAWCVARSAGVAFCVAAALIGAAEFIYDDTVLRVRWGKRRLAPFGKRSKRLEVETVKDEEQ